MLPRIKPMRLRLAREPFDNPEYLMEWKADGFRAIAYVENGEAKLVSRNLKSSVSSLSAPHWRPSL